MKLVFHDNGLHLRFAPLTLTRPLSELRMGLFTNTERWKRMLNREMEEWHGYVTEDYLYHKFLAPTEDVEYLHINSAIVPDSSLVQEVRDLKNGEELRIEGNWVARKGKLTDGFVVKLAQNTPVVELKNTWDLFQLNHKVLASDFFFWTANRNSQPLSSSNTVIGDPSLVFLEEGAVVEAAILNTLSGPIYVGAEAEIMEGCMVRGGLALGEHAALKMGAKIYGATSIGPHCKVGGEVSNSIFIGYSNKGHDGFLGNSVLGEWCNLGADTNSSNLKNNYSKVSVYSYETQRMEQTDVQFLGMLMGDHSKTGINTMLNTATVVGVSANVFGAEFPSKYIPSFAWGSFGDTRFDLIKAFDTAHHMMQRRGLSLTPADKAILRHLFEQQ
jgi:UDP-N-acetylglucosamine diphosphorylase/glucosamine-1-phosphate N-acetyltransferase